VGRIEMGGRERMGREGRRRKGTEKKGKGKEIWRGCILPLAKIPAGAYALRSHFLS